MAGDRERQGPEKEWADFFAETAEQTIQIISFS
jgi:hypothetical protein